MKTLHYINCFFYVLTLAPYATIYYFFFGMYAQLALGVVQLLLALIILLGINKHNKTIKRHIANYWIMTLLNLLIILIIHKTNLINNGALTISFVFVSPMLIASYFVYITHLIQKQQSGL